MLAFNLHCMAQTPSPQWNTSHNANMPATAARPIGITNVGSNIIWTLGYDPTIATPQFDLFSRSTDGGLTFTGGQIPISLLGVRSPLNIEPIDGNTAWVATVDVNLGTSSRILKTIDAGATWINGGDTTMFSSVGSFLNFVCFTNDSTGILCGDAVGGEFEIWRTTNSGANWIKLSGTVIPNPDSSMLPRNNYGSNPYLGTNSFTKYGSNIWFYTYGNQIYHSQDDGANWQSSLVNISSSEQIVDIEFNDKNIGMLKIFAGTPTNFKFSHTTDGGLTWSTPAYSTSGNYGGSDLGAVPGTNIFVTTGFLGGNQYLSYSSDFGNTWIDWGSIGIGYFGIRFSDAAHGWAASDLGNVGGKIYKYNGFPLFTNSNTSENVCLLKLYPNPTKETLLLSCPIDGKIIIYNSIGEKLKEENINGLNTIEINTSNFSKGVYNVFFISKNGFYNSRFLKD